MQMWKRSEGDRKEQFIEKISFCLERFNLIVHKLIYFQDQFSTDRHKFTRRIVNYLNLYFYCLFIILHYCKIVFTPLKFMINFISNYKNQTMNRHHDVHERVV